MTVWWCENISFTYERILFLAEKLVITRCLNTPFPATRHFSAHSQQTTAEATSITSHFCTP